MWKIFVAFLAFAALAIFVLMKSGGDIDMGGEKHGIEVEEHSDSAASAAASSVVEAAASVVSEAASGGVGRSQRRQQLIASASIEALRSNRLTRLVVRHAGVAPLCGQPLQHRDGARQDRHHLHRQRLPRHVLRLLHLELTLPVVDLAECRRTRAWG